MEEEEKEEPARSGVPVIEGTRIESSVVEEGAAIQVAEVEGAQNDAIATGLVEEAASQGEHLEEKVG